MNTGGDGRQVSSSTGQRRRATASASYLVRVVTSGGPATAGIRYVGPFADRAQASAYAERIGQASNGTIEADVEAMTAP